jgi:hypothetical protein
MGVAFTVLNAHPSSIIACSHPFAEDKCDILRIEAGNHTSDDLLRGTHQVLALSVSETHRYPGINSSGVGRAFPTHSGL